MPYSYNTLCNSSFWFIRTQSLRECYKQLTNDCVDSRIRPFPIWSGQAEVSVYVYNIFIFVRLRTCVHWSASSVLRMLVRDCFPFCFNMPFKNATCGLQMPLCAGCCLQKIFIRGFKGRALWLYSSRPQHFQKKSYCRGKKASLSHPNNVPLPFHV